jgi:hypothetical protein
VSVLVKPEDAVYIYLHCALNGDIAYQAHNGRDIALIVRGQPLTDHQSCRDNDINYKDEAHEEEKHGSDIPLHSNTSSQLASSNACAVLAIEACE